MLDQMLHGWELSLTNAVKRVLAMDAKMFVATRRFERYRVIAILEKKEHKIKTCT